MCVCVQPPHKDHQIVSLYHYDERNYKTKYHNQSIIIIHQNLSQF